MFRWLAALIVLGALLPLAGLPTLVRAQGITVTTTTDENNGSLGGGSGISLREAILYAASGQTITLPAGVYNLTIAGNTTTTGDLDILNKNLTITGAGAAATRIVAGFSAGSEDRVFEVQPASSLALSGVTVSGGIRNDSGGGIFNQGTLTLTEVVVSGNFSASINESVISGNAGGGVANAPGAQATILRSEIRGNTARSSGGGLFNDLGATMTVDSSTIANNSTVEQNGGGIANEGTLTVVNSTLSGNNANRSGGGLYNNGTTLVVGSTITDNLCNADTTLGGNGGGAFNNSAEPGSLTFRNSIIAGNQDLVTPDDPDQSEFVDLNSEVPNTIVGNSNNLIGSSAGIATSTTIGGAGDIINPNIELGGLANNGGPTRTHLPLPGSPAIDAGANATCATTLMGNLDQRGNLRPSDGNGDSNAVCEIGSVEISSQLVVAIDDTILDSGDSVDFGTTARDTPLSRTLTISNTGEAALTLDDSSLSLPSGFSLVESFASTLINPGEATTLTIQYDAATLGTTTGVLSFDSNDPAVATYSLTLNGTATAKAATIDVAQENMPLASGDTADFGTTPVNTPVDVTFTITNSGDLDLTLGTLNIPSGFELLTAPSETVLAGGESTSFTVRLQANLPGVVAGTLEIPSDAANANPFEIRLVGVVSLSDTDQIVVFDRESNSEIANGGSVDFGGTVIDTPIDREFRIVNIGTVDLTINSPIVLPSGFSLVDAVPTTTLQPGESLDLTIRATASAAGTISGDVVINNTDSDENPFSFAVSAIVAATPAEIVVSEGSTLIADNTGNINFGTTTVGTPLVKTFTISNTGGLALDLGTLSVPAGFSVVTPISSPVAPGATSTFQIALSAAAAGTFSGTASFSTNDTTANPFNFTVRGVVENVPADIEVRLGTTVVISDASIEIGTTEIGTPISQVFTIVNTGDSTLEINSISIPTGFTRNPNVITADTLAPGASTTFEVVLDAEAEGSYNGRVIVRTNDPDEPNFGFNVTGTVNEVQLFLPMIFR